MNTDYRIRWFEENDSDAFLDMFKLVFEEPMSEDYFNWKYINNPLVEDKPLIVIAEEIKTGTQAGFRPCLPTKLRAGESTFEALIRCDLMVHPDHRRRGINTMMNNFLFSFFNKSKYKFFYNFSREIARLGYLKTGSRDICPVTDSVLILNPKNLVESMFDNKFYRLVIPRLYSLYSFKNIFRFFRKPKLDVSLTPGKIEDLEKIYNKWSQQTDKIHTVRDLKYLKWRFNDMPMAQPRYFIVNIDGEPNGYFIITKLFDKTDSAMIFDYLIYDDDPILFKESILKIIEEYKNKDTIFTWAFTSPEFRSALREIDFLESTKFPFNRWVRKRYFLTQPTSIEVDDSKLWEINGKNITNLDSWYITPSSCDIR